MAIVFFDLDGTLLPEPSSERRFIAHLLRRGEIGTRHIAAAAGFALRHGARYGRNVFKKDKAYLSGLPVGPTAKVAESFVEQELSARLFPDIVERLHRHQRAGDTAVLLTGSPQFLAAPLAAYLAISIAIGTRCAVQDGVFQAGPPILHPLGPEKLHIAKRVCATRRQALASCIAYADAEEDRHLMAAVGRAVAVNPDRRLRRLAAARGWQVLLAGPVGSEPATASAPSLAG